MDLWPHSWFPGGARRVGRCVLSISHFPRKLVEGAGTSQNKATLPNLEIINNKDNFFLPWVVVTVNWKLFVSVRHGLPWGSFSAWREGRTEGPEDEQSCGELHLEYHSTEGHYCSLFFFQLLERKAQFDKNSAIFKLLSGFITSRGRFSHFLNEFQSKSFHELIARSM